MDPNATYELWEKALKYQDKETAVEAAENLIGWLNKGGFEPRWSEAEKCFFMEWAFEHGVFT